MIPKSMVSGHVSQAMGQPPRPAWPGKTRRRQIFAKFLPTVTHFGMQLESAQAGFELLISFMTASLIVGKK